MRIGILGTGTMAAALAEAWALKGHEVIIGGRSEKKSAALAGRLAGTRSSRLSELSEVAEVLVVAVAYDGITDVLRQAGGPDGRLGGKVILDCTNSIDYTSGRLIPESGSAAEEIQLLAKGAQVVKALHLYAGADWLVAGTAAERRTVVMAGDDPAAITVASKLVTDLGGVPALIGGLDRARQLEEAAGFVTGLARIGVDPSSAVPHIQF
jgi:predicted dinucleotide-binding enzyme